MTDAPAFPVDPAPATGFAAHTGALFDRVVDRLNPILVREIRQALNGKAFLVTGILALLSVLTIALIASASEDREGRGASVFLATMTVLAPIVLFIVPLQAFASTRQEVTQGTIEHLMLSRLRPGQIVRGKLWAAIVQFVLYLALFAPLLALTFLLRGVDVPTIAYAIGLAFVSGISASSLAVAGGALSRWPNVFKVIPFAVVILGLGGLTFGVMGGMSMLLFDITREIVRGNFWEITTAYMIPSVSGIVLFGLVGTAALAHPYENRSTGFRIFAVASVLVAFGWMTFALPPSSGSKFFGSARMLWELAGIMGTVVFLFLLFAATEDPRLSPRVASRVPRSRLLALLVTPWLPGAGRGFIFTLLVTGLVLLLPPLLTLRGYSAATGSSPVMTFLAWGYIVFYVGLASFVRRLLASGSKATWVARGVPVVVLFVAVLLPFLVTVLADVNPTSWSAWRVLDPFTTVAEYRRSTDSVYLVGVLAMLAVAANVPSMATAIREVLRASRERRRRAR